MARFLNNDRQIPKSEQTMSNLLTILGSGSARPTRDRQPSAQLLELDDKQFLIDCGEGTQIALAQMGLRTPRLDHIFISHLHGDHCFGLMGLISTWGMLGRTKSLTLHAPSILESLMRPLLDFFCQGLPFEVVFQPHNTNRHEIIYEDRTLRVSTLPLKHKVPCCGFLFEEKEREPHIRKELIEQYQIPLADIPHIKAGGDFITADGRHIPYAELTFPAQAPLRYAYCSDTAYTERLLPWIDGVDWLYHEATFAAEDEHRCKDTAHSTTLQAATIAQKAHVRNLIIGHFSARKVSVEAMLQEARSIFRSTIAAHDKMQIELN